jgi:type IV secretory pathway VirB10-like protein
MEPVTPPVEPPSTPVSTVSDRRPIPRGVIPRGVQTWMLAGLALFMMVIMLVVGRPDAPARPAATQASLSAPAQSADRVRDYQERLRAAEARALAELQAAEQAPAAPPAGYYEPSQTPPPEDPIAADRRRREYESLFASNVVLSRRAEPDRPDAGRPASATSSPSDPSAAPSMDEIADAAVRATARAGAAVGAAQSPAAQPTPPATIQEQRRPGERVTPERTDPITAAGPLHRVLEGTVIDAVLSNRLDGSAASPVNCLVTNPVYSHSGQHVLIPGGSRVLGQTRPVQALGETRLAVAFHRLLMPDGRTYRLDQFMGLNQIGDAGLRDRVNQHYLSTFGAAAAVGLISGLAQFLGSAGLGRGDGDRTVIIAGGVGDATAQASLQVMSRFLNRLPTVTIREGHRVKVYLTSDLELPAYVAPVLSSRF